MAENCIKNSDDDWMTIKECVGENNITETMATKTEKAKEDFEKGLAIFINNKHDPEARKDFIKQICSLLPVSV